MVAEFELILKQCPDVTFVAMADGAFDNGRFLSAQNPDVDVLDFSHTPPPSPHLSQASEDALSPKTWYAKWRALLRPEPDGVDRVIRAIRGLCSRASSETAQKALTVQRNSFRTHRHRMNDRDLKQKGGADWIRDG